MGAQYMTSHVYISIIVFLFSITKLWKGCLFLQFKTNTKVQTNTIWCLKCRVVTIVDTIDLSRLLQAR